MKAQGIEDEMVPALEALVLVSKGTDPFVFMHQDWTQALRDK